MTLRTRLVRIVLLAALGASAGCGLLRESANGRSADMAALPTNGAHRTWLGAARFAYDDFGGLTSDALETNAFPWKVVTAALALTAHDSGAPLTLETVNAQLTRFGFIVPTSIANWPDGPPPRPFERPLGLVTSLIGRTVVPVPYRVEIANLTCAACHAGVTYDAHGNPTRAVWLGLPNTSVDFEGLSWAVYRALRHEPPTRILATVRTLYPRTDAFELQTLRELILPRVSAQLATYERRYRAPLPYRNGAPGMTNGGGALKRALGLLPPDARDRELGFTSIPALGDVALRSCLLADCVFSPPGKARFAELSPGDVTPEHVHDLAGIIAFFAVPAMGDSPDRAEAQIPKVIDVLAFLQDTRGPRFPGPIDTALAETGRHVYRARCASCHGSYDTSLAAPRLLSLPNRLVPNADLGTDTMRFASFDTRVFTALMATAYRRHVAIAATGGYVAPRLSGVWATAPYLHNGSVPTLWALMHPAERPTRFLVGGHRLDFAKVGIALVRDSDGAWRYPAGYLPWSEPHLYDARQPGLGNQGHADEFEGMTEAQKLALLEYLKLL